MITRLLNRLGVPVLMPDEPHLPKPRRNRIVLPWVLPCMLFGVTGTTWIGTKSAAAGLPAWWWFGLGAAYVSLTIGVVRLSVEERRYRRWFKSGACLRCGYDLRATPNKCPECGLAPEPR